MVEAKQILWSIAGFDPSSGAGITADLMTFAAHGCFGCSAITALTVQSTQGVRSLRPVPRALLQQTLECLLADLPPAGIKIGMLGSQQVTETVAAFLRGLGGSQEGIRTPVVVLDPVLRASSGKALLPARALRALREELLPQVGWITPNWAELAMLTGCPVNDVKQADAAARALQKSHPGLGVIATGGDQQEPLDLIVAPGAEPVLLVGDRVETTSTHGTGCAFSSALLARLVQGLAPAQAAQHAKDFVTHALQQAPGLGAGRGPMELLWPLRSAPGA